MNGLSISGLFSCLATCNWLNQCDWHCFVVRDHLYADFGVLCINSYDFGIDYRKYFTHRIPVRSSAIELHSTKETELFHRRKLHAWHSLMTFHTKSIMFIVWYIDILHRIGVTDWALKWIFANALHEQKRKQQQYLVQRA